MLARKTKIVEDLTDGIAGLFKKNKVTRYEGTARLDGPGRVGGRATTAIAAKHVIIATGSVSASLPGVELDGDVIGDSTEALAYPTVPEHLVVIGAGYIGLELGCVWQRLGAKVTVVEYLDRILPGMDAEIAREAHKLLKRQGLEFGLGARVTGARREGDEARARDRGPRAAARRPHPGGRRPQAAHRGPRPRDGRHHPDERGRIPVDEHFRTAAAGVYAIGDVIGGPMLAHKAEDEGVACVEAIVTGYGHVDYDAIPGVCYTEPEIAVGGPDRGAAEGAGRALQQGRLPLPRELARARPREHRRPRQDPRRRGDRPRPRACTSSARAPATSSPRPPPR